MSKNKTSKSKALTTTTGEVDPRKRMKEIRALVVKTLKEGGRVDLLPMNAADKARAMVALQDLYETEVASHNKATKHIAALVDKASFMDDFIKLLTINTMASKKIHDNRINELKEVCEKQAAGLNDQHKIISNQFDKETDLMSRNAVLREERKALKATIAIFAGDNT